MTFEEFKDSFIEKINEEFGSSSKIKVHEVIKNNGIKLTGVTVAFEGVMACPSIYVENYYSEYLKGYPFEEVMDSAYKVLYNCRIEDELDLSVFDSYSNLKEHVLCKLINTEKNAELLKDVPHVDFLDLSAVFYVILTSQSAGYGTVLIRNAHFEQYNVSLEEMFEDAKQNTKELFGSQIRSIEEVLLNLIIKERREYDVPVINDLIDRRLKGEKSFMYVLSNEHAFNGAMGMLDNGTLYNFGEMIGSDFYIIPSSIHELILVPVEASANISELKMMVKEVNENEVPEADILSDSIYYFDRKLQNVVSL